MIAYGFVENKDYVVLLNENVKQTRGGHNRMDYALTLDTAKHFAMMKRTDKGMIAWD